jgi:hypothetical protein
VEERDELARVLDRQENLSDSIRFGGERDQSKVESLDIRTRETVGLKSLDSEKLGELDSSNIP